MIQPLWRKVWRFLKKLKIELPYDPAIPLLGICPEKTIIQNDTCTPIFAAALFIVARTWKQPKCPSPLCLSQRVTNSLVSLSPPVLPPTHPPSQKEMGCRAPGEGRKRTHGLQSRPTQVRFLPARFLFVQICAGLSACPDLEFPHLQTMIP